jgi:opacity protein-like surface antigen
MKADISLKAVMTNVYLRNPRGTLHPYVGFGLGWAWLDIDMDLTLQPGFTWPGTSEGVGRISTSDSDYALQLLLGFDWYMTEALALDIGYRYFYTQAAIEDSIGTIRFDIDTNYTTHMFTAGLKYMF